MKDCNICKETKPLKVFMTTHGQQHVEAKRACEHCWEDWLSAQVEEKLADEIRCIDNDCPAIMSRDEIKKFAFAETWRRYVATQ